MLQKVPRRLPTLADMMNDLHATPAQVARALGVSVSTVYRWLKDGAPRVALLAIYWMTSWGLSELDAETYNRAQAFEGLTDALRRALEKQRADFARLSGIGDFGSANDPLPQIVPVFGLDGREALPGPQSQVLAAFVHGPPSPLGLSRQTLTG